MRKRVYQLARHRPGADKPVVFVVGCQRSGTSLMHHLLRLDYDTVTHDEMSPLSAGDPVEGLRWAPLPDVVRRFPGRPRRPDCRQAFGRIAEPRQAARCFPGSCALWMYRDFRAVAPSNVAYFPAGTSHRDLNPSWPTISPIGGPNAWRRRAPGSPTAPALT
ncbi:MAG: hypothetical protein IPG61_20190 [bacterium]|nr:hypothetical protein [bacterium]